MGYGILALCGYEKNAAHILKRMFLPFYMNTYWFISSYVVLYVFFPVFNLVIRALNKKENYFYLCIMLFVFTVLPIMGYQWIDSDNSMFAFITIYCLGASIRKYKVCLSKATNILLFIIMLVIDCLTVVIQKMINMYPWRFVWGLRFPVIATAVFMFLMMLNIDFKNKKIVKIVSKISTNVFGIYLFHNGGLLPLLLESLSISDNLLKYWYYPVYMIISAIIIFILGMIVDCIWKKIFESNIIHLFVQMIRKVNKQY